MPDYPNNFAVWTEKKDNIHVVAADHVNLLQSELDSTQRHIGLKINVTPDQGKAWYPQGGSGPASGSRFWAYTGTTQTMDWKDLKDRLLNLERAALRDLDFNYISLWGGSIITPGANVARPADTGGLAVLLDARDSEPAFAVLNNHGANWGNNAAASIWANGEFRGSILKLRSRSTSNYAELNPDTGLTVGRVVIGPDILRIGTTTVLNVDQRQASHKAVVLEPPSHADGETLYLRNTSGGVRKVIHVQDAAGNTKFLLDTNGDLSCNTIKFSLSGVGIVHSTNGLLSVKDHLDIHGVRLDQHGLRFTIHGGSYTPGGISLAGGGGMAPGEVFFNNNQRIRAIGPNLQATGPLFHAEGGIIAQGMQAYLYHVTGLMYVYAPPTGSARTAYEAPCRTKNRSDRRAVHMGFHAPITGGVEIHLSAELRSHSRPMWLSYMVVDTATGGQVVQPSDHHGVMNNGARSAKEQTDVDQGRFANFAVWTGLVPGRLYELRIVTSAADRGAGDPSGEWLQAQDARVLIKPLMSGFQSGVISG